MQCGSDKRRKKTGMHIFDYWKSLETDETELRPVGPMGRLLSAMDDNSSVLVMTRGMREVRAFLIGRLIAFDRYWNLILYDVMEYAVTMKAKDFRSSSCPGHRSRHATHKLRKQLRTSDPCGEIILNRDRDDLLNLALMDPFIGEETVASLLQQRYQQPDSTSRTASGSSTAKSVQCDVPAKDRTSAWVPSLANLRVSSSVPNENSTAAKWAPVFHGGQLFVRGANVVLVRVLADGK